LVPSFCTRTLTPWTTPPLESVAVPDKFAKIDCASAAEVPDSNSPIAIAMRQVQALQPFLTYLANPERYEEVILISCCY